LTLDVLDGVPASALTEMAASMTIVAPTAIA